MILLYFLVLTAEWAGLVVAPSLPLDTALFRVLTVEGSVWFYWVWYCCAPPSFPLCTAVLSLSDVGEGGGGSYGVWYCCVPSLPLDTFPRFDS